MSPDVRLYPLDEGFLGAATLNFFNPINGMFQHDFWNASGIASNAARHKFSLATCNGCHGAESGTGFLHVGDRVVRQPGVAVGLPHRRDGLGSGGRGDDLSRR